MYLLVTPKSKQPERMKNWKNYNKSYIIEKSAFPKYVKKVFIFPTYQLVFKTVHFKNKTFTLQALLQHLTRPLLNFQKCRFPNRSTVVWFQNCTCLKS